MTIPSFKILKKNAAERLAASEKANTIVLLYAGIMTAMAVLVLGADYVLSLQIAKTGGLSNMGLRTVLSTIQSVLPMVRGAILMCLELGYVAAMLRIARQQYASEKTLKLGFDRFWVLLRYTLMESGMYMILGIAAVWAATPIYLLTPLAGPMMELLTPIASDSAAVMEALMADAALMDQLLAAMGPLLILCALIYLILCLPVSYSLRMAKYVIIDKPGTGAMYAIQESRKMMKGSRMRLFRLDLSLWWWYAAGLAATALSYGDALLTMLGIRLPLSQEAGYYLFAGLFLAAQFALFYFLRNRVEVVYAQAYNALKPREKDAGVVLGNIFQM